MQVVSFPEAQTPPALRRQARDIQRLAWPSDSDEFAHDPALRPLSMLLLDDDQVVATLDILHKTITHAGASYEAGGLSMVASHPRGQGYGRALVSAARAAMADLDLGIFTCDRDLLPFYTNAGWNELPGAVLVGGIPGDAFPSDQPGFDKVTVCAFFSLSAQSARSSFENARIELYPGQIDKLW